MKKNPSVKFIQIEQPTGGYRTLYTVKDLAECLMFRFPHDGRGEAYESALTACLECLEGTGTPESARSAFVAAAHEIDLFILPDDAPKL